MSKVFVNIKPEHMNWGAKWGVLTPRFRIDRVLDGPGATHMRYVRVES